MTRQVKRPVPTDCLFVGCDQGVVAGHEGLLDVGGQDGGGGDVVEIAIYEDEVGIASVDDAINEPRESFIRRPTESKFWKAIVGDRK